MKKTINYLKQITPNFLKKLYHLIRFKFEAILLRFFYNVKSTWLIGQYSQHGQDRVLKDIIFPEFKKKGITLNCLIDVGSNQPFYNSDSALFDELLNVICIDPIDYSSDYAKSRPLVNFIHKGINDNVGILPFYKVRKVDGWEDQMSSFELPDKRFEYDIVNVKIDRLDNVIRENKKLILPYYGLLIDVEGLHLNVLKSIDLENNRPVFIMVECDAFDFEVIKYLEKNNYHFSYRIGPGDSLFISKDRI